MIYKDEYRIGFKKVTTITVTNSKNLRIVLCSMGASIFKCYFGRLCFFIKIYLKY